MQITAHDGTEFDSELECRAYEATLAWVPVVELYKEHLNEVMDNPTERQILLKTNPIGAFLHFASENGYTLVKNDTTQAG